MACFDHAHRKTFFVSSILRLVLNFSSDPLAFMSTDRKGLRCGQKGVPSTRRLIHRGGSLANPPPFQGDLQKGSSLLGPSCDCGYLGLLNKYLWTQSEHRPAESHTNGPHGSGLIRHNNLPLRQSPPQGSEIHRK